MCIFVIFLSVILETLAKFLGATFWSARYNIFTEVKNTSSYRQRDGNRYRSRKRQREAVVVITVHLILMNCNIESCNTAVVVH